MNHYLVLVTIILSAGLFGGLVNFSQGNLDELNWASFSRNVLSGIAASVLVPLFLEMISSDLLLKSKTECKYYFIFTSFCLIASIFSKRFISSVGDKVLQQVEETKREVQEVKRDAEKAIEKTNKNEENIESIIESASDTPDISEKSITTDELEKEIIKEQPANTIDGEIRKFIQQLFTEMKKENPRFRTVNGLAKTAQVPPIIVEQVLRQLQIQGMAREIKDKKYWTLTAFGRAFINSYNAKS